MEVLEEVREEETQEVQGVDLEALEEVQGADLEALEVVFMADPEVRHRRIMDTGAADVWDRGA